MEKAHALFQHELFGPHPKSPFAPPPPAKQKLMCLISWERTQKSDPHKHFRGPKRAIFGHKKFSLLFSALAGGEKSFDPNSPACLAGDLMEEEGI